MKKDFYPDRTICNLQLELRDDYAKMKKLFEEYYNAPEVIELLIHMYEISKSIHYKAGRMEKRLLKYRQAIESLGFKRV